MEQNIVKIYSDGACSGNPGPGGWAAVLLYKEHKKEIFGSQKDTTNNQMELKAAIESLKILKKSSNIEFYTDSTYVKDGITKWIFSWKKNNWRNSKKQPVKNVELWQELDKLVVNHKIEWHWVKGHSGDTYNDLADKLAYEASRSI
jgi:ribonuclease HI